MQNQLAPLSSVVPPAEKVVRLTAPNFPSVLDMLVAVNDKQMVLEWYLVTRLMGGMQPAFAHMSAAKTLARWTEELSPEIRLREISSEKDLSPSTLALQIKHPALPKDRHYFLVAENPEYPITFLDIKAEKRGEPYRFHRYHISTLGVGSLLPPAILFLVYKTLTVAGISGNVAYTYDVELALVQFEATLRTLFTARGMKW
ncbi:MAG: hypothetical protein Q7S48_02570 [bacterium]|nr:hypothetical protein [bacterium]